MNNIFRIIHEYNLYVTLRSNTYQLPAMCTILQMKWFIYKRMLYIENSLVYIIFCCS